MPSHSKKSIKRAGESLAREALEPGFLSEAEKQDAWQKVGHWRTAHMEPLKTTLAHIDETCEKRFDYVLVSRLKRAKTIIDKLNRSGYSFTLTSLRDIAGCRIIVNSIDEVQELSSLLAQSEMCVKELDYIRYPKDSGYRGFHVVYRLGAPTYGYDKLSVEIQIRSRRQHAWATAVEAYDIACNTGIKFGLGTDEQKEFFSLASRLMTMGPEAEEKAAIRKRLRSLDGKLDVFDILHEAAGSMFVVDNGVTSVGKSDSCLITVQPEMQEIDLEVFPPEREIEAASRYTELEKSFDNDSFCLLARAASLEDLKRAYPNYYFNITEFLGWLAFELER